MITNMDSAGGTRVGVVEDHPALLQQLVRFLGDAGMSVVATATTVREGIEVGQRERPHVLVVDNNLPDGRGIDVCRAVARLAPEVVLLLHTGAVTPDEEREAIEAGAAEVVFKSVRGAELLGAIRRWGPAGAGPASL